jgi:hypothetical protein
MDDEVFFQTQANRSGFPFVTLRSFEDKAIMSVTV